MIEIENNKKKLEKDKHTLADKIESLSRELETLHNLKK